MEKKCPIISTEESPSWETDSPPPSQEISSLKKTNVHCRVDNSSRKHVRRSAKRFVAFKFLR
jgi:hypothetical protein